MSKRNGNAVWLMSKDGKVCDHTGKPDSDWCQRDAKNRDAKPIFGLRKTYWVAKLLLRATLTIVFFIPCVILSLAALLIYLIYTLSEKFFDAFPVWFGRDSIVDAGCLLKGIFFNKLDLAESGHPEETDSDDSF